MLLAFPGDKIREVAKECAINSIAVMKKRVFFMTASLSFSIYLPVVVPGKENYQLIARSASL